MHCIFISYTNKRATHVDDIIFHQKQLKMKSKRVFLFYFIKQINKRALNIQKARNSIITLQSIFDSRQFRRTRTK